MARKLREKIDAPGARYHIVCRGIGEKRIFKSLQDYKKFLKILRAAKKKFSFYLYSYNLLPNHIHLFIETGDISISEIMHYINTCYAIYFNRRYKQRGHLFQDRFFSSLIATKFYHWSASAYIDLNALRAGLCKKPEDYKWSSYQFYFQKDYNDDLIDRDRFLHFGGEGLLEELRKDYIEFVEEEAKNPKRPKFIKSEKFV